MADIDLDVIQRERDKGDMSGFEIRLYHARKTIFKYTLVFEVHGDV